MIRAQLEGEQGVGSLAVQLSGKHYTRSFNAQNSRCPKCGATLSPRSRLRTEPVGHAGERILDECTPATLVMRGTMEV
jgi:hypothetical protein